MNIMTWHAPSKNGAFQKETKIGIFSSLLTTKPVFSFHFTSMSYVEQTNSYTVDNIPMTTTQKAEVFNRIMEYEIDFNWFKDVKSMTLSSEYQSSLKELIGIIDSTEISSWTKQESEARAYTADNKTPTPIISALIIARGLKETVDSLSNTIIEKADKYAVAYATILGAYQAKLKKVKNATTLDEILLVR